MATQTIEIRAVDKASRQLGLVNKSLQKVKNNTDRIGGAFDGVLGKVAAVASAIGAGFGLRKIIQTSSEVEQLGLRFQFLFGSVEEGTKAFDTLVDFASKVPFTLQEIQAGAGNLAVISENAEELGKNLGIVGNVAAVTGLDFKTVSEQVQRAFSGGIAAAEIFREKGVRALLGFQDGVKVTAGETQKRFEEVFGPNGPFGNATEVLANTYEGVLSMIQDKIFKFTLALGRQGGLFDFAKGIAGAIDKTLTDQFGSIEDFAAKVGKKIITVVKDVAIGTAQIADAVTPVFNFIADGVNNLIGFLNILPPGIRALGIVGFLVLGTKAKLIVIAISSLFEQIIDVMNTGIGFIEDKVNDAVGVINGLIEGVNKLPGVDIPLVEEVSFGRVSKAGLKRKFDDFMSVFYDDTEIPTMGKIESAAQNFLKLTDDIIAKNEERKKQQEEILNNLGLANQEELQFVSSVDQVLQSLEKQREEIQGLTLEQKVQRELDKLKLDSLFQQKGLSEELVAKKKAEVEEAIRANIELREAIDLQKEFAKAIDSSLSFERRALGAVDPDEINQLKSDYDLAKQLHTEYLNDINADEKAHKMAMADLHRQYLVEMDALNKTALENVIRNQMREQEALGKMFGFKMKKHNSDMLQRIGNEDRIQEMVRNRVEFEKKSELEKTQFGLEQGAKFFQGLGAYNKKFFAAYKAFAIAQAIINTYQGATKALATYPPPFNFIAAAATVASGLAQVATIRAQTAQRGGNLITGGPALVGEDGPELIVPKQPSTVIPREVADAVEGLGGNNNGPVNVNFNITTTDAKGFDSLLVERRATIVGIINQAMNTRGKTGVTV